MLIVHHLSNSLAERVVWACEELGLDYELRRHDRDADTRLAPVDLKKLHPMGTAPVLVDGEVVLAESAAIVDYLVQRHGGGRLALPPDHPRFADYLFWLHFTNGSLQPAIGRVLMLRLSKPVPEATLASWRSKLDLALRQMDDRLRDNVWLAGADFTAAEVMAVFSLTTMRRFEPLDLTPYPHIVAWLQRIGVRPAYIRAMEKAEPGRAPLLSAIP